MTRPPRTATARRSTISAARRCGPSSLARTCSTVSGCDAPGDASTHASSSAPLTACSPSSGWPPSANAPCRKGRQMAVTTDKSAGSAIRPFTVEIPQADVEDLRARIAATRWPEKETVADETQGVQLATIQALARYWVGEYDFGRVEA